MNGFEAMEVSSSVVVVAVAFDSASWKSTTLEVTILAKKKIRKTIDFVLTRGGWGRGVEILLVVEFKAAQAKSLDFWLIYTN